MAFVAIPNGVRIVHLGTIGGQTVVNTVGCQNGVSTAGDALASLATMHGDAWRSHIVPLLSAAYSHTDTLAYSLEDESAAPGDAAYSSPLVGSVPAANGVPAQVCMVASLKTGKRGPTYQGRMFISPVNNGYLATATSWAPSGVSTIQTALNAYKADVDPAVGDNGRMAICSKGSPSHGIAPHVEPVTGILVRSYLGTQRRRVN